jgi:LysM repeat protein
VDYVASINKYYVAYRLAEDLRLKKDTGSRSEVPKTETVSESPSAAGGGGQKGTDKSALKASTKKASAKAPARKPATRYHTVRKGETLYGISRRYGLSVNELKRLNKIPAGAALKPGERLRLSR